MKQEAKRPLVILTGPTAVGKSALAVSLEIGRASCRERVSINV